MNNTISCHALATTATLAALLMASAVNAGEPGAVHSDLVNATGACNGALPGFEGALRKRALAIANEGSTIAFINCSVPTDGDQNPGYFDATATFVNRSAATATVNCTLVGGIVAEVGELFDMEPPAFRSKSVTIALGAGHSLQWQRQEFGVPTLGRLINFSCTLPPRIEIALVGGSYQLPQSPL